jgi:hypothetical protein
MGLLRGMARTAVVAGTATAVSNRVSRRQSNKWAAQDAQAQQQVYEEQAQAAPQQSGPSSDYIAELQQLGQLKEQGIITQAEFEIRKREILG